MGCPDFPVIAGGQIPQILGLGEKAQTVLGCTVVGGGTGVRQVTLDDNLGVSSTDVIVKHNPGFGTSKSGGGITTTMSTLSAGSFLFTAWDQSVVPPVEIDAEIHFEVKLIPRVK